MCGYSVATTRTCPMSAVSRAARREIRPNFDRGGVELDAIRTPV